MRDIKELDLEELEIIIKSWASPSFHAKQIFSWIFKKGAQDFDEMSDLPWALRRMLKKNFFLFSLELIKVLTSQDGTKKFLLGLKDKNLIEAVIIPTQKRVTACLSTQIGCKFACRFCASGLAGFKRNLSSGEIIEEILVLKNNFKSQRLTHAVFMGGGEPLDNYDNVLKAIRIINSDTAVNLGARRITLSTCGIIPGIRRLSDEGLQIELSVSLHAASDKTRSQIMPINKKYPLKELMRACQDYINKTGRQITFEYILIEGVNSDLQNAKNLYRILKGLNCKVNLIPFNPIREYSFGPPNKLDILLFRDYLLKSGINVTLRQGRGKDIEAACGQLRVNPVRNDFSCGTGPVTKGLCNGTGLSNGVNYEKA